MKTLRITPMLRKPEPSAQPAAALWFAFLVAAAITAATAQLLARLG